MLLIAVYVVFKLGMDVGNGTCVCVPIPKLIVDEVLLYFPPYIANPDAGPVGLVEPYTSV